MTGITPEQAVLGSILLDNSVLKEVKDVIDPEDFQDHINQQVFKAMLDMKEGIDTVTLDKATKGHYTMQIMGYGEVPTAANALYYANIVKDDSNQRKAQEALNSGANKIKADGVEEALPGTITKLQDINTDIQRAEYCHIKTLLNPVMKEMTQKNVETRGIKTHIRGIDKAMGCMRNGDLIVIAARPSMGKTALALSVILNMGLNGDASLMFSIEMTKEQLTERLLCQLSGVSMQDINLKLDMDENTRRITDQGPTLWKLPIYINDKSLKFNKLLSLARHAHKNVGIKAIFIDYLQIIPVTRQMGDNRNYQLGHITRNLKALAKELNVPVILLCQLNRKVEERPNKRPRLSDLRDSGEIEQDADVISFIYRDEVYNKNSDQLGIAEIIFAKCRNFSIGYTDLEFKAPSMRFTDIQQEG
jgi:replicative DNA helicase